jgi:site-specific recombinase XerD
MERLGVLAGGDPVEAPDGASDGGFAAGSDGALEGASGGMIAPDVASAVRAFVATLVGKSPQTERTYRSSLARFQEFLEEEGLPPASVPTDALPATILERFHAWLVRGYGRDRRSTVTTYLAGARAFVAFLDRRRLLAPETTSEQMRGHLRQVIAKGGYKTPRIDQALPLIVVQADKVPLPPPGPKYALARLELLRDRAILHTLFATGMRREEIARLNREDVDDGWSGQALITGKGDKERVAFFTDEALAGIRTYLDARADRYAPLFLRHDRRRGRARGAGDNLRFSPLGVWRVVKRYALLAGVDASPHDFRHAKASTLLNRGAKLSEVQDILGHASPETTKKIYAHYETAHLRDAFDRYSASLSEAAAAVGRRRPRRPGAGDPADPATPIAPADPTPRRAIEAEEEHGA